MKVEDTTKISEKREKEKQLMKTMITIYCHGHKHRNTQKLRKDGKNTKIETSPSLKLQQQNNGLCEECETLLLYSYNKINRCPFMETKTFCNNCHVHCYQKEQREKIKEVMRFAGPRMLYRHPVVAIKHAYYTIKQKSQQRKHITKI